jgi:acyl-CoA synthetase (AMP-forming)/AMP-acid ligase II
VAVLTDERTLKYRELADETASVAAELGAERRLVLIETRNELSTLVAYLGALAAHHVVMPLPAGGNHETVIRTYAPDVIVRNGSIAHRPGPGRRMHPELALLLSTSGSTGSPKLVRLSTGNLRDRGRHEHRRRTCHQHRAHLQLLTMGRTRIRDRRLQTVSPATAPVPR